MSAPVTAPEAPPQTVRPRRRARADDKSKTPSNLERTLVTVEDVSFMLAGTSVAKIYQMRSSGQFGPAEHYIGSKLTYLFREVVAWVEAGMPNRERWNGMKPQSFYAIPV